MKEVLELISTLLIGPLKLLFEIVFAFANRFFENPGYSIIFLSLAMNFLVLPLYKRADAMQAEQRDTEQKLKHWTEHIKKNFKGDERFMILQTYQRQNNYKPTDALKGSVSLLLEIPFFIAAYQMISGLQLLKGVEFGLIKDLGAPDQMFMIGSFPINVLPILMTLINIISGAIYTKGMSKQSKIQLYGMAAIFLVLLYKSPAGVVFYWTLNNVFSLVKNIFYKLKNPKLVLSVLSSICGVGVLIFGMFIHPMDTTKKTLAILILAVALQTPIIFYFINKHAKNVKEVVVTKKDNLSFFLGGLYMAFFTGLLIPSDIIKSSPVEFINTVTLNNPLKYMLSSLMLALGTFVVWFGIFYMLASDKGKKFMSLVMWLMAGVATLDYMAFGTKYGNLSAKLKYDVLPLTDMKEKLINLALICVVALVFFLIWKFKPNFIRVVYTIVCVAILGTGIVNANAINKAVVPTIEKLQTSSEQTITPKFNLSKKGKNVVIIMADRAINCYIPYLFNEKPEVKEQFDGFTYYPNTISYGGSTNIGSPALYGGYEYTPEEINKRNTETIGQKQDEALKVLPVLYNNNGYDVSVFDPSYAGYGWLPDPSIYDEYDGIKAMNVMPMFENNDPIEIEKNDKKLKRNFFFYSIFRISPVIVQPTVYANGLYNSPDDIYLSNNVLNNGDVSMDHIATSISKSTGLSQKFMNAYQELDYMPEMTNVVDTNQNTFLMMSNDTAHEPMLLQLPEYVPSNVVDNTEYDAQNMDRFTIDGVTLHTDDVQQMAHYHSNMAMVIKLGEWFDYLRENGVYDNTKIIIVADHAFHMDQYEKLPEVPEYGAYGERLMQYNPLLMVKDFGAEGFTTNNDFMTNADTPTIATMDTIENPVNPFTNKPINNDYKKGEQHICVSHNWNIEKNNGTQFVEEDQTEPTPYWVAVHDDIFDINNWRKYNPYE